MYETNYQKFYDEGLTIELTGIYQRIQKLKQTQQLFQKQKIDIDVENLQQIFDILDCQPQQKFSYTQFEELLKHKNLEWNNQLQSSLYTTIDQTGQQHFDFKSFKIIMCIISTSLMEQKVRLMFTSFVINFEENRKNLLNANEALDLMMHIENNICQQLVAISKLLALNNINHILGFKQNAEEFYQKLNKDSLFFVNLEDFIKAFLIENASKHLRLHLKLFEEPSANLQEKNMQVMIMPISEGDYHQIHSPALQTPDLSDNSEEEDSDSEEESKLDQSFIFSSQSIQLNLPIKDKQQQSGGKQQRGGCNPRSCNNTDQGCTMY